MTDQIEIEKKYKLHETLSKINKFRPKYPSTDYPHPVDVCLREILEDVLWDRSGLYEASTSSCGSRKSLFYSEGSGTKSENISLLRDASDHKLACWRNHLEERRKISERIMQKTGKRYCNLLVNTINEHRRIELVKRILDYAERLRPDKLLQRRGKISTLEGPCPGVTTLHESLPTTEKTGIPIFPMVDVTKKVLEEEGMEKCITNKWSWLKSKYLAERLFCKSEDIQHILSYFPEFFNLEVIGQNIPKYQTISVNEDDMSELSEFSIENIHMGTEKEEVHTFNLMINEFTLSSGVKMGMDLEFPITCESSPNSKEYLIMCTIRNGGSKILELQWEKEQENLTSFIEIHSPPVFFFDKNDIRLMPGQFKKIPLIFCSRISGIYNETWKLHSNPPAFFKPNKNIMFHLQGYCKQDNYHKNEFMNIKDNFTERTIRILTVDLLNTVAKQAVPDPIPKVPYLRHFTEREIFTNLYPNMNYLQAEMDELKAIYRLANIESSCRCCPEWNYDLEGLKQQILDIDKSEIRKKLYFKMINIIHRMRQAPEQPKSIYEEQKFFLVKSVIISTLDKIETVFMNLNGVMMKTNLPLEFDEVIITDRQKKNEFNVPPNSSDRSYDMCARSVAGNVEDSWRSQEDSTTTLSYVDFTDVVKSDYIRLKQKQIYSDALYLQFFAHLGKAAEEIAAVIEGMKNLF